MKLTFVGADHQVTGSCHFLQACGKNMLVDCGMQQGSNPFECCEMPVDEAQIDYVFLTHAHVNAFGKSAIIVCAGASADRFYDGGVFWPVFHHAARLCAYSDAGGRVEKQKGKTAFWARAGRAGIHNGGRGRCDQKYRCLCL